MNQQITAWVGIDVSKATFDAAFLINEPSNHIRSIPVRKFKNDGNGVRQLNAWIAKLEKASKVPLAGVRVVMEATGRYSTDLYARLVSKRDDLAPAIINPTAASRYRDSFHLKQKDDTIDARALSYYGRDREPEAYQPPSKEILEIRRLVGLRRSYVESQTAYKNRRYEAQTPLEIEEIDGILLFWRSRIKELDQKIRQAIRQVRELTEDVKLLKSIPGVGFLTAAVIISVAGDLRRFKTSRECGSYAGCVPQIVQSGTSVWKRPKLSKAGNSFLRSSLYMACMSAIKAENTLFKETYDRLRRNGKTFKQAMGAIMRKMIVVMRSILKSGEPFRYLNEATPRTQAAN